MHAFLAKPWLLPAVLAAFGLGSIALALAAQYWGGLLPCVLCHYQRYAHGAAGGAGLLALALMARPVARRDLTGLGALSLLAGAPLDGGRNDLTPLKEEARGGPRASWIQLTGVRRPVVQIQSPSKKRCRRRRWSAGSS